MSDQGPVEELGTKGKAHLRFWMWTPLVSVWNAPFVACTRPRARTELSHAAADNVIQKEPRRLTRSVTICTTSSVFSGSVPTKCVRRAVASPAQLCAARAGIGSISPAQDPHEHERFRVHFAASSQHIQQHHSADARCKRGLRTTHSTDEGNERSHADLQLDVEGGAGGRRNGPRLLHVLRVWIAQWPQGSSHSVSTLQGHMR